MPSHHDIRPEIILGEFRCRLDNRYRVPIPPDFDRWLTGNSPELVLAKERPGCLSLWNRAFWEAKVNAKIRLVQQKVQQGFQDERIGQVQLFGRLLSSRHQDAKLDKQRRLTVPKSFRDFLGVKPRTGDAEDPEQSNVMVVGAAVCVEVWNPAAWLEHLRQRMPKFRRLIDRLF
ncbi:MAG: division/cell wall cluster transcriptional repressor MraZ [Pirellulales bacterium]|nr:division/cell wall cluster transcriptional repressor MraZ [Pirellulales bacterium]